ncbi:Manganese superoxide dismutase [Mycena venus]|uniref:Manganese superoxide dismutase n=1 Tax=Mycena venus TaxID=2733690 RepID=A0A8H6WY03_9AGAR|nr:Manganese superoxide dismutase [Mycena venus]
MSFLWRTRHAITRARRPLIPRGTRGVTGQFNHLPVPLPYDIEDGLGNFLPPPALEAIAMEYQLGLLARLTDEVRNTDIEDSSVTQIIISTAPFREKTLAFNYASLALNNSYFLGQLTPNPADAQEDAMSTPLSKQIRLDHGGLEQFKSTFSAAAMGMFTSGWIWFVTDKYGSTSILPTLGPGTLLVRSRTYAAAGLPNLFHEMTADPFSWDRKSRAGSLPLLNPKDLAEFIGGKDEDAASFQPPTPPKRGGATAPLQPRFGGGTSLLHTSARQSAEAWNSQPAGIQDAADATPAGPLTKQVDALHYGEVLYPLFCISVQEHAWLTAGYGIWGKEAWLREFWNVLNWRQVSESYAHILSTTNQDKS